MVVFSNTQWLNSKAQAEVSDLLQKAQAVAHKFEHILQRRKEAHARRSGSDSQIKAVSTTCSSRKIFATKK
jgi:hypothetical protein